MNEPVMSSKRDQHEEKEPVAAPPAKPGLERALLVTVIVLGVFIVAGLGAVLARIIYLSSAAPAQQEAQGKAEEDDASSQLPFEAQLSLPEGAVVRSTSISSNRLAVHYESPNGAGIAIVDLVTGRTLGRLRAAPAGSPR
jgi:hypothetical protein